MGERTRIGRRRRAIEIDIESSLNKDGRVKRLENETINQNQVSVILSLFTMRTRNLVH